jgi:uncharacterized protein (TIGR02246 family)
MAHQTLEQELLALEKQYWQAQKDKDGAAAAELTDEACLIAGAQGVVEIDRRTLVGMMEDASWSIEDYSIGDDVRVRQLDADTAILAYKVHEDLTVDGEPVSIDAADTSAWVRRDGRWLCALHTESITGDPFGRDRAAAASPS